MGIKRIYTGLLLTLFLLSVLLAGLGGRSESLPFWPGAFLLAVTTLVGALSFARGYHGRASKPALWAMAGFAGYIVLRSVSSYYSAEGVAYIARQDLLFAAAGFLCYLAVTAQFEKLSHRSWILAALLGLAGLNLYAGLIQSGGQSSYQPQATWAQWFPDLGKKLGWEGWSRVGEAKEWAGVYQSENHFAGLLAMLGPLFFGVGLFSRGPKSWICLLATAGCAQGVMASTSRGGTVAYLIGLVAVLVTWFLWKRHAKGGRTHWKLISGALAGLSLVGYVIFKAINSLSANYATHGVLNQDQITSRFVHAELAWKQFLAAPIFGTGARSYEYMERSFRSLHTEKWNWYTTTDMDAIFAHCDWAQLMGDFGFVGGGLAIAVLVTHFVSGLHLLARTAKEQDQPGTGLRAGLAAGALGGVIALAAVSILDFNLHIAANICVVAILLAILANPGRVTFEQKEDAEGMPIVPRHGLLLRPALLCGGVALSLGILIAGPDLMRADRNHYAGLKFTTEENYNYFEAANHFQLAKDFDTQHYMSCMEAGNLNIEEARRIYLARPEKLSPKQLDFSERIRRSHLRRAAEWFEKAYELYPRLPYSAMGAGHALSRAADYDTAEGWFQKALVHGQASRKLAIEYGTHLMSRAIASLDLRSRRRYLGQALYHLTLASDKFRATNEDRHDLETMKNNGTAWLAEIDAEIAKTSPERAAEATADKAAAKDGQKQPAGDTKPAAPKPLVPATQPPDPAAPVPAPPAAVVVPEPLSIPALPAAPPEPPAALPVAPGAGGEPSR